MSDYEYNKLWRKRNLEHYRKYMRDYFRKNYKKIHNQRYGHCPWVKHYDEAKWRCSSSGYYAGRVKFLMTKEDFKSLWFRDKAWLLKQPSIDRINPGESYIYKNCRFIELAENIRGRYLDRNKLRAIVKKNITLGANKLTNIIYTSNIWKGVKIKKEKEKYNGTER